MIYDQNDLNSMALCVWKEARSLKQQGMLSVACVIRNRVGAVGFPKTLHDVIFQKNAFSSMTVISDKQYSLHPLAGDLDYAEAFNIAHAVLEGTQVDVTKSAHYYDVAGTVNHWFNTVISGPDEMGTPEHPFTVQIGTQRFYV